MTASLRQQTLLYFRLPQLQGWIKKCTPSKTSDMQRSLWEMERQQIWTLSLKLKKKSCSYFFLLGGSLIVANTNIKSIWTERFHIRAVMTLAEMWSRRLLIVSIYGLGQVAPTRANNCLDTFPAGTQRARQLGGVFVFQFFVFYTPLLGLSKERPLNDRS